MRPRPPSNVTPWNEEPEAICRKPRRAWSAIEAALPAFVK
jgi:hypothetical protein